MDNQNSISHLEGDDFEGSRYMLSEHKKKETKHTKNFKRQKEEPFEEITMSGSSSDPNRSSPNLRDQEGTKTNIFDQGSNPFDWISNHSVQNDSEPRHEEFKLSDEETKAQTSNQDIVTLNSDSSYSTEPITNQARVHK